MEIKPKVRKALEKMDFITQYKDLSHKHSYSFNECFENYDNDQVLKIFQELGYEAKYIKKENFFRIIDKEIPYEFGANISLKYGVVELIWIFKENGELHVGSPLGILKMLLDNTDEDYRAPVFRNYNDLQEILKDSLAMYEDFKQALINV